MCERRRGRSRGARASFGTREETGTFTQGGALFSLDRVAPCFPWFLSVYWDPCPHRAGLHYITPLRRKCRGKGTSFYYRAFPGGLVRPWYPYKEILNPACLFRILPKGYKKFVNT
jgi:hypothetical protein